MKKTVLLIMVVLIATMVSGWGSGTKIPTLRERSEQYYAAADAGDQEKMKTFISQKLNNSDRDLIVNQRLNYQSQGYRVIKPIFVESPRTFAHFSLDPNDSKDPDFRVADWNTWEQENGNWYIIQ